jgi:DNA-binding NtrC family response regulator
MHGTVTALLIFHQSTPLSDIEAALEKLAIRTKRARTLAEARHALSRVDPPLLAFTESKLPDGNWSDVLSLSQRASSPVNVIVVGREIDTELYASAIEIGAFDFIAPPFEAADLAHVVRCAADNALERRGAERLPRSRAEKLLPSVIKSHGNA